MVKAFVDEYSARRGYFPLGPLAERALIMTAYHNFRTVDGNVMYPDTDYTEAATILVPPGMVLDGNMNPVAMAAAVEPQVGPQVEPKKSVWRGGFFSRIFGYSRIRALCCGLASIALMRLFSSQHSALSSPMSTKATRTPPRLHGQEDKNCIAPNCKQNKGRAEGISCKRGNLSRAS
jgi:hypothetical protein